MWDKVFSLFKEGRIAEMDELLEAEAQKERDAAASAAAAPVVDAGEESPALPFLPGHDYRVHFKNGCSGEYAGAVLARQFPFDPEQIVDVERIG